MTPSNPRVFFATASFHRAWGEYLFVAEQRATAWQLFFWDGSHWQPMPLFEFNVIHAASMPRIVVADDEYVDELVPHASNAPVPWVFDAPLDEFTDWQALLRGHLDPDHRRAALEAMVEFGDVTFTTAEGEEDEELDDSEKVSLLEQSVTDAEILDNHDMSQMRMRYLIPRQHVSAAARGERVN